MNPSSEPSARRHAGRQEQFLDVVDRDTAAARFRAHLTLRPVGTERVDLSGASNRVLAADVVSEVDVPGFDRSNVDGFAVQASDTFGASEEEPRNVTVNDEVLSPGIQPSQFVASGTATTIATGAVVPRGADAVVMVEHTELIEAGQTDTASKDPQSSPALLRITRSVSPGGNITFAGTDIARGETVLRSGQLLTSREIGVLAAIGMPDVEVFSKPRIAIISTGDELVPPGAAPRTGSVYDSNSAILAASLRELSCEPVFLGIVCDDMTELRRVVNEALQYDGVVLSGGTSKGAGDLAYRVVDQLHDPGIVVHGVALKPGKPVCLAVTQGKPVVILPGFPTSAIFTFHEFLAPVLRDLAGLPAQKTRTIDATLPLRINSERGRAEFLLVSLMESADRLAAYPMGKGSGSVTTFSGADGFIRIDQQTEILESGSRVAVQLLGHGIKPADLILIGSHCVGLDFLLGLVQQRGMTVKSLYVGSTGGLAAAKRGECDIAGIHLLDAESGTYNRPFLTERLQLISGYGRMQGFIYRRGDARFDGQTLDRALAAALNDPACLMVNRNPGSGTRILIDRLLDGRQPPGYAVQAKSHNAVAAAIAQGRADWGIGIATVVSMTPGLALIPVQHEQYDFAVPTERLGRPGVRTFCEVLGDRRVKEQLSAMEFLVSNEPPESSSCLVKAKN